MKVKIVHFAVTAFVFILSSFLFIYFSYTSEVNVLSADFKTTNAVKFKVEGRTAKSFIKEVKKSGNLNHVTLYDVSLENSGVRTLYCNSDSLTPHIREGRFFTEQDFISSVPRAVVGKNRLSETYTKNGEKKIKLFYTEYTVVGVMGYKDNYSLNKYIFINRRNISENEENTLFLLDSASGQAVNSVMKELESRYEIQVISEKISNIDRMYKYNNFNSVLIMVIALFIAALAVYIVYLQYAYFRSTIQTFYILGFHKKEIKSFNRKLFLIHGVICFLISLAGAGILFIISEKIHQLLNFTALFGFIVIISISYMAICELALAMIFVHWRGKHGRMCQE